MLYIKNGCNLTVFNNMQNLYVLHDANSQSYLHIHYLVAVNNNGDRDKIFKSEDRSEKVSFAKVKKVFDIIVDTIRDVDTINKNVVIDISENN